jgi:hypothetical protein
LMTSRLHKALFILLSLVGPGSCEVDVPDDAVSFQVRTDKTGYHAGENAILTLTLVNRGREPIYVSHRGLGICGQWIGFVEVRLLDHQDKNTRTLGCDVFVTRISDENLKAVLNNGMSWVIVMPGEVYGSEEKIDLPSVTGSYRLVTELRPPSFSEDQMKLLELDRIRVLSSRHSAPPVMISIK